MLISEIIRRQASVNGLMRLASLADCKLLLMANKADGNTVGINNPLTNPWQDLTSNSNDITLYNVAGTEIDGYTNILLPNGKTKTFFSTDGDSYGDITDNGSLDFTGTQNFAFCLVIKTTNPLSSGYIFSKNTTSTADIQYGLFFYIDGSARMYFNGALRQIIPSDTLQVDTVYNIKIIRINELLKCEVNGVEVYNASNTIDLISRPFIRLFCRSNSSDGSSNSVFYTGYTALMSAFGANVTEESLDNFYTEVSKNYIE